MVLGSIINRRSIRSYKSDEVLEEDIIDLIKAAQFAPSSKNNRAVQFIVIKNKKTKEQLYQLLSQNFLKQAPVLIVPVTNTQKSANPVQDLSVASENIFIQAASLGLGTVWKNVAKEKMEEVKKILNVPQNFLLINIIPVGFIRTKKRPHNERDFNAKKIHFEKW